MNTPNKITVFRIFLLPFVIFFLLCPAIKGRFVCSLIAFLLAAYTDYLDGNLARKWSSVTDFGKFADPLADKALVMSVFICFVELGQMSAIGVIIFLVREFLVMSVRLMAVENGKVVAANYWGKAKTTSQMLTCILIMAILCYEEIFGTILFPYKFYIEWIKNIFVWLSVILSSISGVIYIHDNYQFIKTTK